MTPNTKRHFLECRSLAEMAITLTVLSVIFLLPLSFACVFLGFILGLPKYIAICVPVGLWLLAIICICLKFIRIGRAWPEPRMGTREFSHFQWASSGFVLILTLVSPSAETAPLINDVRWFLTILFLIANLIYVSLAFAIKAKFPPSILWGLLMNVATAFLSLWRK
jgi:hypothetical protein